MPALRYFRFIDDGGIRLSFRQISLLGLQHWMVQAKRIADARDHFRKDCFDRCHGNMRCGSAPAMNGISLHRLRGIPPAFWQRVVGLNFVYR